MASSPPDFSRLTVKIKLDGLPAQKLQEHKERLELGKKEVTRLIRDLRRKGRLLENNNSAAHRAQPARIYKRKDLEIPEERSRPENAILGIKRTRIETTRSKDNNSPGLGSGKKRAETLELNVQPKKTRKPHESSGSGSRRPRPTVYSSKYSHPPDRVYSQPDKQRILKSLDKALGLVNGITKIRLLSDLKIEYD